MVSLSAVSLLVAAASAVHAGNLSDVKKVVLFMQENRAFDHYYGTMAGVRWFRDPNVLVDATTQKPIWYLPSPRGAASEYLLPFYLSQNQFIC